MPTHMIHLAVANSLNGKLSGIDSFAQFCLGSISPDAIHVRKGITGSDKAKTHLLHKEATLDKLSIEDVRLLQNSVIEFIQRHKQHKNYSFFLGYGVHILTDIHWSEMSRAFQQRYLNDETPSLDRKTAYYNDLDQFDYMIYQGALWKDELWTILKDVNEPNFNDILDASEIREWKKCVLNWFNNGRHYKNPAKYFIYDDIMNFIEMVTLHNIELINNTTRRFVYKDGK